MEYKGFLITAEVECYEQWTINEDGSIDNFIEQKDWCEVSGYHFDNDSLDIHYFQAMSETDGDMLREMADDYLKEHAKSVAKC